VLNWQNGRLPRIKSRGKLVAGHFTRGSSPVCLPRYRMTSILPKRHKAKLNVRYFSSSSRVQLTE
jgi:hypothetical protein